MVTLVPIRLLSARVREHKCGLFSFLLTASGRLGIKTAIFKSLNGYGIFDSRPMHKGGLGWGVLSENGLTPRDLMERQGFQKNSTHSSSILHHFIDPVLENNFHDKVDGQGCSSRNKYSTIGRIQCRNWLAPLCCRAFPSVSGHRPIKIPEHRLFQPHQDLVKFKYSSGGLVFHCFYKAADKPAIVFPPKSSLGSA